MGKNHETTRLDHARDELMSHVVRCEVLNARMDDRHAWLDDTMEYMRQRYPFLNEMEFARLEVMGRQFNEPAIPHGTGNTARNRPEPMVLTVDGEHVPESAVSAEPEESEAPDTTEEATPDGVELQPA